MVNVRLASIQPVFTREGIERLSLAIRATIHEEGISARELARRAGLSNATLSKYTHAFVVKPQPEVLKSLAPHIYRVDNINLADESLDLDLQSTYGDDWRDLELLATAEWDKPKARTYARVARPPGKHAQSEGSLRDHLGIT